ncbi:MAG: hypothetical protein HYR96_02490 [Deltaproteobacteria bacterium]|nr:hypothetical protein [Deltaproteobacteria bacterium]
MTGSYSYTTATWRAAGDNTTSGQTRLEFVLGQQLEPVTLEAHGPHVINTTNSDVAVGIGIGSTSANSADVYGGTGNGTYGNVLAYYSGFPGTGYNYGQWLEISTASGTSTWYLASGSVYQVGLVGESYQ